jgi:hypothetical protein
MPSALTVSAPKQCPRIDRPAERDVLMDKLERAVAVGRRMSVPPGLGHSP